MSGVRLPMSDSRGDCLSSLMLVDAARPDALLGGSPIVRSLIAVANSGRVLMGYHLRRQQWELPGGAVELGESAHDAAVRELAEETGIQARGLTLAARAEFLLGSEAARHWAAVFTVIFDAPPVPRESEEMADFRWWTVNADLWEHLSPLDAEVARRCLPTDSWPAAIQ